MGIKKNGWTWTAQEGIEEEREALEQEDVAAAGERGGAEEEGLEALRDEVPHPAGPLSVEGGEGHLAGVPHLRQDAALGQPLHGLAVRAHHGRGRPARREHGRAKTIDESTIKNAVKLLFRGKQLENHALLEVNKTLQKFGELKEDKK